MNPDDICKDQERAGRNLAQGEGNRITRPWQNSRPKAVKKPQGHEAHLKMLEASKAAIKIIFLQGGSLTGVVRHSDNYTISIKPEGQGTVVIFKHGIESFEPIDPAPLSASLTGLTA